MRTADGRKKPSLGHVELPRSVLAMSAAHSNADAWEHHAYWYNQRHGRAGDKHHQELIIPAILRHLRLKPGMRILDCCCGQGVVARALAAQGAQISGIDGSKSLIEAAQSYAGPDEDYQCADAHDLAAAKLAGDFDAAIMVLAIQDLDPVDTVLTGIAAQVQPGADLIIVLTHPCFRVPRHSDWFFDRKHQLQKRILDQYMSAESIDIVVGSASKQADESHSTHYHRPLQFYMRALGKAGFGVVDCEELCTQRRGSSGSRSSAEDQAQREFPMFLLLKARKLS